MDKEIVFKTKVDTGNTVKDINNIDKALKEVNTTVKTSSTNSQKAFEDLNAKVESGTMSMREMTRAVKEYQTIALQAGESSPIGKQAIAQAGELKDRLGDLQQQVNNTGQDGKHLQGALAIGSGVVAGYGAVQSAMALVGSDSKELEKTLVKLTAVTTLLNSVNEIRALFEKQSAMMITLNAVKTGVMTVAQYAYTTAVGTTTGAMKALRLSMLAIPIFAIIAGIIALMSAIGLFDEATKKASVSNDELNASFERSQKQFDRQNEKINREIQNRADLAKARDRNAKIIGAIEEELFLKEEEQRKQSIERIKTFLDEKRKFYKKALDEGDLDTAKSIKKEILDTRTKYLDLKSLDGQYEYEKKIRESQVNTDYKKEMEALAKANKEKNKKILEQELERLKNIKNLEIEFLTSLENAETEYYNSKLTQYQLDIQEANDYYFNLIEQAKQYGESTTILEEAKAKKIADINKKYKDIEDKDLKNARQIQMQSEEDFYTEYLTFTNDKFENERIAVNDKYFLLIELAKQYNESTIELEKQRVKELALIDKEETEKKIANIKQYTDASFGMLTEFNNLQNQLDENRIKNDKLNERQILEIRKQAFNREKALKIASISINTAEAVAKSVASSPATFGLPFSAFSIATGLAQIATVASTKFDGGSSSSVSPPSPPSTMNNTNNGGNNNQATNLNGGFTNTINAVDTSTGIKVSVVDSEIKAVMDNSKKTNVISTIGM